METSTELKHLSLKPIDVKIVCSIIEVIFTIPCCTLNHITQFMTEMKYCPDCIDDYIGHLIEIEVLLCSNKGVRVNPKHENLFKKVSKQVDYESKKDLN